jgi:hypothetical protein
MVWGATAPIYSVGYERDAARSDFDSGFTILFHDAPDPEDVADDDKRITWILAPLRTRGIERVRIHADLCILTRLASALALSRATRGVTTSPLSHLNQNLP